MSDLHGRIDENVLAAIGHTPLVRLNRVVAECRAPVLAKCEYLNPGGSLKDRIAAALVDEAERDGRLKPGGTIVEGTGGNTGVGLALVAAVRGYRLVCVLAKKMALEKRMMLARLGADVIVTDDAPPDDPKNFNQIAERLARENGWFHADQFRAHANVAVHEATTARELIAQTGGAIGAFVAGVGTGGTISGVGRVLKREIPGVRVVLADPVGSGMTGLLRDGKADQDAKYALEGMGGSKLPEILDRGVIDAYEKVADEEAFAMTRRLIREEGLLCGGSSGAVVVAALRVARRDDLRGPVVAILADSWDRYGSKDWSDGDAATRVRML
jgi:cysteine synthase